MKNDGDSTAICKSILRGHRYEICRDLGLRASDIVQANSVIWVEGPSDRLYLNWWLNSAAPDLVEGIHYSIMFYGGRLLSHLSATDEDVTEFINLRSLNRNLAIVIDSDKAAADDEINPTKRRIVSEFVDPSFAWITAGREIENYVPHDDLQVAVKKSHSTIYSAPSKGGTFDHALYFLREVTGSARRQIEKSVDKVKVAKAVQFAKPNFEVLDLKERVGELIAFIRKAN